MCLQTLQHYIYGHAPKLYNILSGKFWTSGGDVRGGLQDPLGDTYMDVWAFLVMIDDVRGRPVVSRNTAPQNDAQFLKYCFS